MRKCLALLPAVLVLAALACSITSPIKPTSAVQQESLPVQSTEAPAPEAVQAPDNAADSPAPAEKDLSLEGPWVVYADEGGIWGLNEDGTGRTQLAEAAPDWGGLIPSPSGSMFAYITSWSDQASSPILHVFSMASRGDLASIALSSAATGADLQDGEKTAADEALLASLSSEPAWSPDGGSLAFVGAIDGETADVYSYTVATGVVSRLTSGPSQAAAPLWSPDGTSIVHFGRETFPDDYGNYKILGVWVARADGSEAVPVENVNTGAGSWIPGWDSSDASRFFLTSWDSACWGKDLQLVDLDTGRVRRIWEGGIRDAVANPRGGGLILMGAGDCTASPQVVRVLPDLTTHVEPVGTPDAVGWLGDAAMGDLPVAFSHSDAGWFLFPSGGAATPLSAPPGNARLAGLAPGSDTLIWTGDGLWTGTLDDPSAAPVQILDRPAQWAVPSEGAAYVIAFSGNDIWAAYGVDGIPAVQVGQLSGLMVGWPIRVE